MYFIQLCDRYIVMIFLITYDLYQACTIYFSSVVNTGLFDTKYKSINDLNWQIIGVNVLHYVPSDLDWQGIEGIDIFYFNE